MLQVNDGLVVITKLLVDDSDVDAPRDQVGIIGIAVDVLAVQLQRSIEETDLLVCHNEIAHREPHEVGRVVGTVDNRFVLSCRCIPLLEIVVDVPKGETDSWDDLMKREPRQEGIVELGCALQIPLHFKRASQPVDIFRNDRRPWVARSDVFQSPYCKVRLFLAQMVSAPFVIEFCRFVQGLRIRANKCG